MNMETPKNDVLNYKENLIQSKEQQNKIFLITLSLKIMNNQLKILYLLSNLMCLNIHSYIY